MKQNFFLIYNATKKHIVFGYMLFLILKNMNSVIIEFRFIDKKVYSHYDEKKYDYMRKYILSEPLEYLDTNDLNFYTAVEFNYETTNGYKSETIEKYLKVDNYKTKSISLPYFFTLEHFILFENLLNYRKISEKFNADLMFKFLHILDYLLFEFEEGFTELLFLEVFKNCSLFFKHTTEFNITFYTWIFECFPVRFISEDIFLI